MYLTGKMGHTFWLNLFVEATFGTTCSRIRIKVRGLVNRGSLVTLRTFIIAQVDKLYTFLAIFSGILFELSVSKLLLARQHFIQHLV